MHSGAHGGGQGCRGGGLTSNGLLARQAWLPQVGHPGPTHARTPPPTFSASSSMKMSEPMKMLDSSTSFLNASRLPASRSSSSR